MQQLVTNGGVAAVESDERIERIHVHNLIVTALEIWIAGEGAEALDGRPCAAAIT